ncbi:MAG: DUF4366 domain-containing protein [Oscillospiraceae bacterium]|nr:DUF4366 domain-containing protein [Oscillospiraceae bacterium]
MGAWDFGFFCRCTQTCLRRAATVFGAILLLFAMSMALVACTEEPATDDVYNDVNVPPYYDVDVDAVLALQAYEDAMQRLAIEPGASGAYDIDFSVRRNMEFLDEGSIAMHTSGNIKMIVDGDDMQAAIIMHMIHAAGFGFGSNILEMYIEIEDGEMQFFVFFDGEEIPLPPATAEDLFEEVSDDILDMPEIELEAVRTVEIEEVDDTRVMFVVLDGRTLTDFALESMGDILEDLGEPGVDFAFFLDDVQMTIVTDLASNPLSLATDMQLWVDIEGEELVVSETSEFIFHAFGADVEIDSPVAPEIGSQIEPSQGVPVEGLSDDLESLTFSLNGELYTFPIPFSELEARGWVASSFMVNPRGRRANLQIRNENQSMIVHFINLTGEELPLNETYVYAIFTRFDHTGPPHVTLPGNITIGMPYEALLAIHGEPTRREDSLEGTTELLRYQMDFGYAFMRIDRTTDLVISMNMGMSDRSIRDAFSDRRPAPEVPLPTGPIAPAPEGLSDDMFSFMFSLNGVLYTLSTPFSELAADGWEGEDLDEVIVAPRTRSRGTDLRNGDQTIRVTFFNPTEEELPLSESVVRYISTMEAWHGRIPLVFPQNITMGSTYEEVLAAYGEPDSYTDHAPLRTLSYSAEGISLSVTVDLETNLVVGLSMRDNRTEQRVEIPQFAADDFPISVRNYEAPTSLSDDLNSFIVKIDGDLYRLPAPMEAFVENGWYFSDPGMHIGPTARGSGIGITRGDALIRTRLRNYDEEIRPLAHTFVVSVDLDFSNPDNSFSIELPGGITEDSTMEEVIAVLGQPVDIEEYRGRRTYYFGQEYAGIAFTVHMRTEEIQEIVITHCSEDRDDTIMYGPAPAEDTETYYPEVLEDVGLYDPEPLEDAEAYYVEAPDPGRDDVTAIALLFAVVVLAGGGAGWYFMVQRPKQQTSPSEDVD